MLGTESDQGKGSLFPIQVQKGYVHMALLKRKNKSKKELFTLCIFQPPNQKTHKKIASGRRINT